MKNYKNILIIEQHEHYVNIGFVKELVDVEDDDLRQAVYHVINSDDRLDIKEFNGVRSATYRNIEDNDGWVESSKGFYFRDNHRINLPFTAEHVIEHKWS